MQKLVCCSRHTSVRVSAMSALQFCLTMLALREDAAQAASSMEIITPVPFFLVFPT